MALVGALAVAGATLGLAGSASRQYPGRKTTDGGLHQPRRLSPDRQPRRQSDPRLRPGVQRHPDRGRHLRHRRRWRRGRRIGRRPSGLAGLPGCWPTAAGCCWPSTPAATPCRCSGSPVTAWPCGRSFLRAVSSRPRSPSHRGLVYVLNAGGTGSLQGYAVVAGTLRPLPGSYRSLGLANTNPPNLPRLARAGRLQPRRVRRHRDHQEQRQ